MKVSRHSGDQEHFRVLYPRLRRFAAVVGPPEDDPADLVQDALERTLRVTSLAELDDPERYLRTVIVRLAANRRRGLGLRRRVRERFAEREPVSSDVLPSDLADLYRLAPAVRAVLYLVEVEGRSFREAAALLDCSEEAARARATRGRRQLRAELLAEEGL